MYLLKINVYNLFSMIVKYVGGYVSGTVDMFVGGWIRGRTRGQLFKTSNRIGAFL